jgi:MFS family permease
MARWVVLGLLMLISFSHLFHRVGLSSFVDQMIERWNYGAFQVGLIQTAFLLTYTAAMVPGGWLADRVGTWRTLVLVSAGTGVFGGIVGGAHWLELGSGLAAVWMVAVLGCMGICAAPLFPSTSRTVAAWFEPEKQVWANALVTGAALFGVAASAKVLSELGLRMGWPAALAFTGAMTLGIAVAWAGLGRESPRRASSSPSRERRTVTWTRFLRHRGLLALAASYGCLGYAQYVFFYWLKYYFKTVLGYSETLSASYTSIPILGMMIGTPLGGVTCSLLARRRGLRRAFPLCSMAFMAGAAAFIAAGVLRRESSPEEIVLWFTLACACIGMSEGPFWTTAVRLGGNFGATAAGVVNTGGNLGGLLAPGLTPLIASGTGWAGALLASSAVIGAGALLWLAVDPDDPYLEKPPT